MRAYSILPLFLAIAVTPAPLTQVVVYHPGSMHVTQTISGMCWESSIASARRDAFRCIIANIIHDPCFALDAQDVACPVDVVRDRGIVVRIASTPSTRERRCSRRDRSMDVHPRVGKPLRARYRHRHL